MARSSVARSRPRPWFAVLLLVGGLIVLINLNSVDYGELAAVDTAAATLRSSDHATDLESEGDDVAVWVLVTFSDGRALGEGMHLLAARRSHGEPWDGRQWLPLAKDKLVFTPAQDASGPEWAVLGGPPTVFRDPSIMWRDGWFHLVFTTELCAGLPTVAFHCDPAKRVGHLPARFGYARSRDLLRWQDARPIVVPLAGACNVWAPEWHELADDERTPSLQGAVALVVFSATVSGSGTYQGCPWDFGPSAGATRHLPYYMSFGVSRRADVDAWGPPRLLFDPGESAIDTILFRAAASLPSLPGSPIATYAIYKSERNGVPRRACAWRAAGAAGSSPLARNASCTLAMRLLRATSVLGPYEPVALEHTPVWSDAISRQCAEGPTLIPLPPAPRMDVAATGTANDLAGGWLLLYDGYRTDCALLWNDEPGGASPSSAAAAAARTPAAATASSCEVRSGLRLVPNLADAGVAGLDEAAVLTRGEPSPRCVYMGAGGFGALHSADLRSWRDVSTGVTIPRHHKHGTALRLHRPSLCAICRTAQPTVDASADAHVRGLETMKQWAQLGVLGACERATCEDESN